MKITHKQIGLVLSGGGLRGIGHIALLQALEETGLEPDVISGVSMGAIIGALYAAGHTPDELLAIFRETPIFRLSTFTLRKPGLLDSEKNLRLFKKYLPTDGFSSLSRKLFITTTNLQQSRYEIFSEGPLYRPLMASAALPPLFSPVEINGELHTDGCIMNSFPTEPLLGQCDLILGSSVNGVGTGGRQVANNLFKIAFRTARLRMVADAQMKFRHCDYVLAPAGMSRFNALNPRRIDAIYDYALEEVRKDMDRLVRLSWSSNQPPAPYPGEEKGRHRRPYGPDEANKLHDLPLKQTSERNSG